MQWRASLARYGNVHSGYNDVRNVGTYLMYDIFHDGQGGVKNLVSGGAQTQNTFWLMLCKTLPSGLKMSWVDFLR